MDAPFRTKPDHRSPEWVDRPTYFVTICTQERGKNQLCGELGTEILRSIRHYHENGRWFCECAVLMPDHVHLLLSFREEKRYQQTIGDWKRWVTTHCRVRWQENFFEHRLRKEESLDQKAQYIFGNPVRAGLVGKAEDWAYFWQPVE